QTNETTTRWPRFRPSFWLQVGPSSTAISRPAKEVGIAYLFLFLLGGFSAQRFYLGLIGSAIVFNVLWWGGWILAGLVIGIPMMVAAGIWWFVDLFLLPSLVRNANTRALAAARMTPLAPIRRL
ncbi:TM2 domain-containing protein, partial [Microbacterium trichothecenolyticum]